jgi:hypothetical protein
MRNNKKRSAQIITICLIGVSAMSAAGLAIADSLTPGEQAAVHQSATQADLITRWDTRGIESTPTAPVPAVPAALAAFDVFRGPVATGLPDEVASSRDRMGLNPDLARSIPTTNGEAWVIPGDHWVCLVVPMPGQRTYGKTCLPSDVAASKGIWARTGNPADPDISYDTLVVPKGVSSVKIGGRELAPSPSGVINAKVSPSEDAPALVR